jgi:CCR4-NOT transcriptional regulation complex NOT5 subunit
MDVDYYIESNQESDFKENELMYEEIDMENLNTIMAPVLAVSTTQSYPPSLCNGTSSSLGSNSSTLMDMSGATLNLHSHFS